MKYFLDTNIIIYFLKGKSNLLVEKFRSVQPQDIYIPSVVYAELLVGAEKSQERQNNLKKTEAFVGRFTIISFGKEEAMHYAHLRAMLEKKGKLIGPNDLMIAAIVLSVNGILVTNNEKEFNRVQSLKITNWTK